MINFAIVFLGMMIAMIGVLVPLSPPPETENERTARAVRAFFKGYTDSHQVSYIAPKADGEWEFHVRSLDNRGDAYVAVPVRLLMQLSKETGQPEPWTRIAVDAVQPTVTEKEPAQ